MESSSDQTMAGSDPQGGLRCHHCAGPLSKDMVIHYSICLFMLRIEKHGHVLFGYKARSVLNNLTKKFLLLMSEN